jgi:hypothetical protein
MRSEAFVGRLDDNLPNGFEEAVLARTTRSAEHRDGRGGRGSAVIGRIGWLGWFAAVAAMIVAWLGWWPGVLNLREQEAASNRQAISEHQNARRATASQEDETNRGSADRSLAVSYPARSWISTTGFVTTRPQTERESIATIDDESSNAGSRDGRVNAQAEGRQEGPIDRAEQSPASNDAAPRLTMSEDDALTLESTARVLELLATARLQYGFADVERARRIAEYDELLDRLAEARARVDARVRPTIYAAEAILIRLVHGPLSRMDARELGELVRERDLAEGLMRAAEAPSSETVAASGAGKV